MHQSRKAPVSGKAIAATLALGIAILTCQEASAASVSPSSVAFQAVQGGANPSSQTITVDKGNNSPSSWTATDSAAWLSLSPTAGTIKRTTQITISVNASGLAAGTYTATVSVALERSGSVLLPVTLTIRPATTTPPPTNTTTTSPSTTTTTTVSSPPPSSSTTSPTNTSTLPPLSGTLPLQFTSTVPEILTTSLAVTVPAGATASTLRVNCYDCDHTDWGSLSVNGDAPIAIWPGPGPSNASGTIRIPVPVSAWRTGTNTLAFTHSQYIAGRVDGLTVTFTTTSPLPLQFTATTPETFTTSLQVTVPAGAIGSTLTVNCYDCDHTDWGSLSVNGGAPIAIWPGPGPSNASGTIRIPVPVSAWRTGTNTLAFTHSQYIAGRVDGLTVTFTTTSPPTTSTTSTTTTPATSTTTPTTNTSSTSPTTSSVVTTPTATTSSSTTNTASGTSTPTTNTSSGTTTAPTAAPPQVTNVTNTATGLTVTCANQPASIRYQTDLSSTIVNPVACNPTYSLVRKWASGETFICVYARDAAGVENTIDYRCVPSPATTTSSTTSPTTNQSAILSWTLGTDTNLAGYQVYVGTASGTYNYPGSPFTVGKVNTYTINSLPIGQTYFFALKALNSSGQTSAFSAEVSKSIY